jgi:hypothetical protein
MSNEPGWERRQREEERRYLEQASVLQQIEAHLGGIADATKAPAQGDVLAQATATIPSSGAFHRSWPGEEYQAVTIGNTSTSTLIVVAGSPTPSGSPPQRGAGQVTVPPGIMRTVSLFGASLTIYGAVGAAFDFTAYSRPRSPSAGACR